MSKIDYKKIGFKAGLEIHQQLKGKKLFCECPAEIREEEPDFVIQRQLRASVGESGKTDVAASHEQRKQKIFEYQGYHEYTCLVETDEEPVSKPNPEAVESAVLLSEMMDMRRVDEVHVMRKAVADGSNTSGFQRTMVIAFGGKVNDVRIDRICLEEDSCKIVSRSAEKDVYNLSRLGIPLLEITTLPDIKDPTHLQDTAAYIGMLLRSSGRAKRGLGTIRQDVNVSIKGGKRVEIKGAQNLDLIPLLADNEVLRQQGLIALAQKYDSLTISDAMEVTECFKGADSWVSKEIKKGFVVFGVSVSNWKGVLGSELFADYRVGTELAGYAKSWGFGGIIHGDEEAKKYGLKAWSDVRKLLGAKAKDGFVLVVGDTNRAQNLLRHVLVPRLNQFCKGVQSEVRKALESGATQYLRPMPGAARMYPETDVHPFSVKDIKVTIPELLTEKIPRLAKEFKITEGLAAQLARSGRVALFEYWAKKLDASLVADVLVVKEKEIRRRHNLTVDVDLVAEELFSHLAAGRVGKSAVEEVLVQHAKKGSVDWNKYKPVDESKIRKAVQEAIKEDPKAPFGALMGAAMKKLSGKADGKIVSKLLREEIK